MAASDFQHGNKSQEQDLLEEIIKVLNGTSTIPSGLATEITLAAVETAVNKIITADGIKKITDALPAGENVLGKVGGNASVVYTDLRRPNDVIAYTAKDVISDSTAAPTVLQFTGLVRTEGGTGYITKAIIETDEKGITPRFRLYLFNESPAAIVDNSPNSILFADASKRIGYIDFPALYTDGVGSTGSFTQNLDVRLLYKAAAASSKLYGVLTTLDAFAPKAEQNFRIILGADNN